MKSTILTVVLMSLTMAAAAQNNDSTCVENDIMLMTSETQKPPMFPGGQDALMKYLSSNVQYPEMAAAYGVEGSAIMSFFVEEDGTLSDITAHDCKIDRFNTSTFSQETESRQKELKKQFALLFAKEGARVIRNMPKWTPGTQHGKAVRMQLDLRINFVMPTK